MSDFMDNAEDPEENTGDDTGENTGENTGTPRKNRRRETPETFADRKKAIFDSLKSIIESGDAPDDKSENHDESESENENESEGESEWDNHDMFFNFNAPLNDIPDFDGSQIRILPPGPLAIRKVTEMQRMHGGMEMIVNDDIPTFHIGYIPGMNLCFMNEESKRDFEEFTSREGAREEEWKKADIPVIEGMEIVRAGKGAMKRILEVTGGVGKIAMASDSRIPRKMYGIKKGSSVIYGNPDDLHEISVFSEANGSPVHQLGFDAIKVTPEEAQAEFSREFGIDFDPGSARLDFVSIENGTKEATERARLQFPDGRVYVHEDIRVPKGFVAFSGDLQVMFVSPENEIDTSWLTQFFEDVAARQAEHIMKHPDEALPPGLVNDLRKRYRDAKEKGQRDPESQQDSIDEFLSGFNQGVRDRNNRNKPEKGHNRDGGTGSRSGSDTESDDWRDSLPGFGETRGEA